MNERAESWKEQSLTVMPYNFDTTVHYPFGAHDDCKSNVDIVHRPVPMYNESVLKQIKQSVISGALKRQMSVVDVGAGVPKAPVVRQLFVDAVSGNLIGDFI